MTSVHPSRFTSLLDLTRLPWFGLSDEGRLVMTDKSIGPIADMHTHLALAYVRPMSVDLHKLHAETQHYLPSCCAIDLDVYVNRNMSPEIVKELTVDLSLRCLGPRGMRATHTIPNLTREMDEIGIRASVLLPIDFPVLSQNAERGARGGREHRRQALLVRLRASVRLEGRAAARRAVRQGRARHQDAPGRSAREARQPARARALRDVRRAQDGRLLALRSRGHRAEARPVHEPGAPLRAPDPREPRRRRSCSDTPARCSSSEALDLQLRYPNVWLETSSQSLRNVTRMVERADTRRVVHGSDWPFYHPAISVSKVLIATEGKPEVRRQILWDNGARLLGVS